VSERRSLSILESNGSWKRHFVSSSTGKLEDINVSTVCCGFFAILLLLSDEKSCEVKDFNVPMAVCSGLSATLC